MGTLGPTHGRHTMSRTTKQDSASGPDGTPSQGHPRPALEPAAATAGDEEAALPAWTFSAPWRAVVERRRGRLLNELGRLDGLTAAQLRERDALRAQLDDAGHAARCRVGPAMWWWGTQIERAWARLHEVEERIVDLVPVAELEGRAAAAAVHATGHLPADDQRLLRLQGLSVQVVAGTSAAEVLRPAIVDVLRAVHDRTDVDNVEARYLRNRLLFASTLCLLVAGLVLLIQWRLAAHAFTTPTDGLTERPTTYLFLVMTFGAIGALLTAIPTMTQIRSDFSPFNLPLQQAVLKLTFAPIVALVGFAIVNTLQTTDVISSDVVSIAVPTTIPAVFVLAVVFGAAQHIVTRSVDRRANQVLAAIAPDTRV